MKTNTLILSCLAVAVLFGGGGFYAGMQYTKTQTPTLAERFPGGAGSGNPRLGQNGVPSGAGGMFRQAGGDAVGEVVSKDDISLTLKLTDGGSKIIFLSASTTVSEMTQGSLTDVTEGTNVMVVGAPNQDGSVTASQIQIRPNLPDRIQRQ